MTYIQLPIRLLVLQHIYTICLGDDYITFVIGNCTKSQFKKGHRPVCTENTRRKMSLAHKGKTVSEQTKMLLSINKRQLFSDPKNHPWYGKKHTEETKKKMREARKKQVFSTETKLKISKSRKGANNLGTGDKHPGWKGGKKISNARHCYKQRKRGFTPIIYTNPYNEPIDYHHIHPNLPFIIPCPKRIHQMFSGKEKTHFDNVNAMLGVRFDIEYLLRFKIEECK